MAQLSGTPVLILREGTERTRGKDATRQNITAARVIGETIRSALGPRGMDKMLVDNFDDVVITNDGATILKEIDVQHPVAKFVVELSKTQDDAVGDGTTTVAVLAGELLKNAEELLDAEIHPQVIVEGYRKSAEKAQEILEQLAKDVPVNDREMLKKVAHTSMGSKIVADSADFFAEMVVDAVLKVVNDEGKADISNILVIKKEGEDLLSSHLIDGVVLDKEVVDPNMPKKIEKAKIALVADAIELTKTEFDAELSITDPSQLESFVQREAEMIKELANKITDAGANVLICQKGIDDLAQHYLAKKGVLAVRRVKKSDMEKLAKATNAKIISNVKDITSDDLGSADHVHENKVGDDDMIFVEGCPETKAITLIIRGGTELVVDEADRAVHDALCVVRNVVNDKKVVAGGGAPETAIAAKLRDYADTLTGREQLAVRAFADSLEIIPVTLAENGGLDPLDILMQLRAEHKKGKSTFGVNPIDGRVEDIDALGVVDSVSVKRQAISSAAEAAQMILRIDDVIASKGTAGGPPGPEGPGGDMDDYD
ncbi:MAG: thermosome subunit beta [Candidatus Hermodarchaeota archaeon]